MSNLLVILLSETEKKSITIAGILLFIFVIVMALIGMLIKAIMTYQAKKVGDLMRDVTVFHVVDSAHDFRKLAFKKSATLFFKQSLIPVLIAIIAFLTLLFTNIATGVWDRNIFAEFGELFFKFDWQGTPTDPVFVKVFFIYLLARFPDVTAKPQFVLEHLPSYIIVFLFIVSWVYYGIVCQACLARTVHIITESNRIYRKSLDGFNAYEDKEKASEVPDADKKAE